MQQYLSNSVGNYWELPEPPPFPAILDQVPTNFSSGYRVLPALAKWPQVLRGAGHVQHDHGMCKLPHAAATVWLPRDLWMVLAIPQVGGVEGSQ